jgi:hypothetical protein
VVDGAPPNCLPAASPAACPRASLLRRYPPASMLPCSLPIDAVGHLLTSPACGVLRVYSDAAPPIPATSENGGGGVRTLFF